MKTTAQNLAAMAAVLGLCISSAYAASAPDQGGSVRISGITAESLLARKGADDPLPVPGCDDHGTNVCRSELAKNGADDPMPGCDDHGTDLCRSELAKNGADDPAPQPGCDDNGTDLCLTPTTIET